MATPSTNLIGLGIYSIPEAARLAQMEQSRIRRWLQGYTFVRDGEAHHSSPVILGQLPVMDNKWAMSFLDLQEARCLNQFRDRKISWKTLREVHAKARAELGTDHPFSTGQFKTFGRNIMREYADENGDKRLLHYTKNQHAFHAVLLPYLKSVVIKDDSPVLWFPLDGSTRIVIDPKRQFGQPVVTKRGVATRILAAANKAEKSYDRVADWYEVDPVSVRDAVKFERLLAA